MEEIIKRIKIFEGYSEKPYLCPAGKWTIGYGYNFEDRNFRIATLAKILTDGFDSDIAESLLSEDVMAIISVLSKAYTFYQDLNAPRKAVVTDMVYQLGFAGFNKFRKMLSALERKDYEQAAVEMKSSRWFGQSGRRSIINVEQMKTGEWQEI
ncbi:MAG: lysozyme [Denitrovibrio sp.]|nr:MAG: lysozyme [Denitrovibrio sp.]